jgi:hypothetical protein
MFGIAGVWGSGTWLYLSIILGWDRVRDRIDCRGLYCSSCCRKSRNGIKKHFAIPGKPIPSKPQSTSRPSTIPNLSCKPELTQ